MAALGSLLPGILGAINPANILKGIVNTGAGILENISKGNPVDISGNLARGLKVAFGNEQSALGSIGGSNMLEPDLESKLKGHQNAANVMHITRMERINNDLRKAIERNAANHQSVYSEDRTKSQKVGSSPVSEMIPIGKSIESAPAGMPDRRIAIVHGRGVNGMKKIPKKELLNERDEFGYRRTPVQMQGVRLPKFEVTKKKKKGKKS